MGTSKKVIGHVRGHLSKKQAYPIIEQYFRSGMLPREFWEKVGWSDNQFYNWRKRYMEDHHLLSEKESGTTFHPVSVSPSATLSDKKEKIPLSQTPNITEITYPNGVVLKTLSQDPAYLTVLIKAF